jgi:sterol desaturase/sphingolipid hydroxylase (fatty acid hydroxylase superfamily)
MQHVLSAIADPFLSVTSRTFLPFWLGSAALLLVLAVLGRAPTGVGRTLRAFRHPSTHLDVQLLVARQLLRAFGWLPSLVGAFAIATLVVQLLDGLYRPALVVPAWLAMTVFTAVLFVAWDASRFLLHLAMHRVPALWAFHQVHHSAEELTPLTFHRLHPVESLLYQLRGAVVTGGVTGLAFWLVRGEAVAWEVFGVGAVGLALNSVFGNLRHSHVWVSFGRWERWFVSPAQHQLHHALDNDHVNLGTWLAVWDRMLGTWEPARSAPAQYGLHEPNHGHDLWSAWTGPFAELLGWRRRRPTVPASVGREPSAG